MNVEIDEQAKAQVAGLQIRKKLGLMDGRQFMDPLQLQNHPVADEEIKLLAGDEQFLVGNERGGQGFPAA